LGGSKRNGPTPEQQAILDARPDYDEALAIALEARSDLSTCRQVGMVAGFIPWTVMREWCRVYGLDETATEILVTALRYLDEHEFAKRTTKTKGK
jgi:hypothetical protein